MLSSARSGGLILSEASRPQDCADDEPPSCVLWIAPDPLDATEGPVWFDASDVRARIPVILLTAPSDPLLPLPCNGPWISSRLPIEQVTLEVLDCLIDNAMAQVRLQDELNRRDSKRREFTSRMVHDMRGPARRTKSFCDILEREYGSDLDTEGKRILGLIQKSAGTTQKLINDLSAYTQLMRHQGPMEPVDLQLLLDETKSVLKDALAEVGARIASDPLPTVLGRRKELAGIFRHLLENSIEFRAVDSLFIEVSAVRTLDTWRISFEDNGIGVEPEHCESMFQPFVRLHRDLGGSGLGLAACARMVQRNGCQIWAESSRGSGTTVSFTAPACRAVRSATRAA